MRIIDAYCVKPIDTEAIVEALRATGGRLCVVEDHWAEGGLGDAVLAALAEGGVAHELRAYAHLAVRAMPASGKPDELLDAAGISTLHIVRAGRTLRGIDRRRAGVTTAAAAPADVLLRALDGPVPRSQ